MTPKEHANQLLKKISNMNLPDHIPYKSFIAAVVANEKGQTNLDQMDWEAFEKDYYDWYDSDLDLLDQDMLFQFKWGLDIKRKRN